MMRQRIDARVGDAPGEHRNHRGHLRVERVGHALHLCAREQGGDVELDPVRRQFLDQRQRGLAPGVRDGNLDVNVLLPVADFQRLPAHLGELVGEHLEGDRLVRDDFEHALGERLVVGDADLFHQGRVGGQPLDVRLSVEVDDALAVRAVGENFDGEIDQQIGAHKGGNIRGNPLLNSDFARLSRRRVRITSTASANDPTVKSGGWRRVSW